MSCSATARCSRRVREPFRVLWAAGAGLLGLCLFAGCTSGPTQPTQVVKSTHTSSRIPLTNEELVFDERYLDSISTGPPYSARTQREMAILFQLDRLDLANRPHSDPEARAAFENDSVFTKTMENGPTVGFRNKAALLADIYRRIDSLKVLEHNPLTPHK